MATYYWVGGETATSGSYTNGLGTFTGASGTTNMNWVLAFDWNNPGNWYTRTGSWPGAFQYTRSTRSPGAGDIAVIGTLDYRGGITGTILPIAKAPCLWGGATLSGITTTWLGASGNGASQTNTGTGNGALIALYVGGGRSDSQYPFSHFGADGFANTVLGGSADTSPLYDAQAKGFTLNGSVWFGASWESLVNAVAATGAAAVARLNNVSVRANTVRTDSNDPGQVPFGINAISQQAATRNLGKFNINLLKNLAGVCGGGFANQTTYTSRSSASQKISGYATLVSYQNPSPFTSEVSPFYSPRDLLTLSGLTCAELSCYIMSGSVLIDSTCNLAQANMSSYSDYCLFQFQNRFNRAAVLVDLQPGVTQTPGNSLAPELIVANHLQHYAFAEPSAGGGGVNYYGIILGAAGSTFSANRIRIGDPVSGASGPTADMEPLAKSLVYFGGNSRINSLEASKSYIAAWPLGADSSQCNVDIGELLMTNSTLDLSTVPAIDTWSFGVMGATGQINGGIIFRDEDSFVRGSQGVRLWNEQLILSGLAQPALAPPKKGSPAASATPTIIV